MVKLSNLITTAVFCCSVIAVAHAQNPASTASSPKNIQKQKAVQVRPDFQGYPVFVDTGNPEADKADYARRKKEWIAANPENARQLNQAPNPATINPDEKLRRNQMKSKTN